MLRSKMLAEALRSLVVEDGGSPALVAERFRSFLVAHGLAHLLPAVLRHLERIAETELRASTLFITAAHPLGTKTVASIAERMHVPAHAPISVEHDEDVLGGFVGRFGEMIYDASMRRQISLLRSELLS